jgi:hypothetical protein
MDVGWGEDYSYLGKAGWGFSGVQTVQTVHTDARTHTSSRQAVSITAVEGTS